MLPIGSTFTMNLAKATVVPCFIKCYCMIDAHDDTAPEANTGHKSIR